MNLEYDDFKQTQEQNEAIGREIQDGFRDIVKTNFAGFFKLSDSELVSHFLMCKRPI